MNCAPIKRAISGVLPTTWRPRSFSRAAGSMSWSGSRWTGLSRSKMPRCDNGFIPGRSTAPVAAADKTRRANQDGALIFGLLRCVDYKRLIVADRLVAWPARCVADKCAVFCKRAVRRTRYLPACSAVTRCAIVFASGPLSKNHGCCTDAAGINVPKSWAGVFDGRPLLLT